MIQSFETLRRTIEAKFGERSVLVVGDLMLDSYLWGDVSRISPEAPVPVLRLSRRSENVGGAGNVGLNLAGLGMRVVVCGFVGADDAGRRLGRLIEERGISCAALEAGDGRPTTMKTRVIGGHQQMLRIDEETTVPLSEADETRILQTASSLLADAPSVLVISDYNKGTVTSRVCQALIAQARQSGIPVLIDPKGRDYRKYAHATALTPNRHEIELALGRGGLAEADLRHAARGLLAELGLDFLVVTQGEKGVTLIDGSGDRDFPATAREVFDVSGAGDTLIATVAAGLAAGLRHEDALRLANLAAGVVVGKVGTAPVRNNELLAATLVGPLAVQSQKICDGAGIQQRVAEWRNAGKRVVFTNGCFDLLHAGHVALLAQARSEGDRLVVGLNTDRSVRLLKGNNRPVVAETNRAQVLAGLACVDAVVLFDEETPYRLIETVRPDVLVKGSDYSETQVVGAELVRSWGGTVVLVPLVEGQSTTSILGRVSRE